MNGELVHKEAPTLKDADGILTESSGSEKQAVNLLMERIQKNDQYFFTTLPLESRADKVKVHQALGKTDNDIDDLVNMGGFQVKDCIVSRVQFTNQDGELVSGPKVTLISPTGDVKSVIARIWCEQFVQLFYLFGLPPWNEPLTVGAKQNKGQGANRFYSLVLVG